jgi:hypothetical protein
MFAQRAFLIQRLKEKREVIEHLVAKAPSDKEIYAGWRIKELLAHLSGWDDSIIETLQAHAKGEPVSRTVSVGINAYNAKTVHTRESLGLEQVIKEWKATRELVFHALDDLPDKKFNQPFTFPWGEPGTVAYLIENFVEHEEHHARHLAQWLENPNEIIGEH